MVRPLWCQRSSRSGRAVRWRFQGNARRQSFDPVVLSSLSQQARRDSAGQKLADRTKIGTGQDAQNQAPARCQPASSSANCQPAHPGTHASTRTAESLRLSQADFAAAATNGSKPTFSGTSRTATSTHVRCSATTTGRFSISTVIRLPRHSVLWRLSCESQPITEGHGAKQMS